ncbi:serine--tRNA ligase, partial [Nanoarchaeota archaeon NZ13-N]
VGLEYSEDIEKKIIEKIKEIDEEISNIEKEYEKVLEEFIKTAWNFPNIIHPDVPVGDESYNKPIRYWGVPKVTDEDAFYRLVTQDGKYDWRIVEISEVKDEYIKNKELLETLIDIIKERGDYIANINYDEVLDFEKLNRDRIVVYAKVEGEMPHHYDLVDALKLADTEKASEVAGSRFYYEIGNFALWDLALSIEGVKFLEKRGYRPMITPYLLKRDVLNGIITLDDFEDMMYKIEGDELFLIGTAEHSITAFYYDSIIEERELPIKVVGWSPCFRREAGAHGKDTKGLFRVHQFHKVEQYIFCKPDDSEKYHEELIKNAEDFLKMLNIPFRTMLMASRDMGKRNYKQYDIEGWFPGQQKYRELVSGSNVTDWQSRRCNIRYRTKDNKLEFVHTLNCTLTAVQRTLLCILENGYRKKDGKVIIPRAIEKYLSI